MSTPVQDVYRRFLSRIGMDILTQIEDRSVAEEIMLVYLEDALDEVDEYYNKDLLVKDGFINCKLTSKEIGTIADAMLLYWLQPQIHTQEMIKMSVTDSDYTKKNTASLLERLRGLRKDTERSLRLNLLKQSWKRKSINE